MAFSLLLFFFLISFSIQFFSATTCITLLRYVTSVTACSSVATWLNTKSITGKTSLHFRLITLAVPAKLHFVSMVRLILPLWLGLSTLITFSSSKTLCPRIFFQNINEETMPYKIIEDVYIRENSTHNNFPIYRRENDNLLFYYTTSKGIKFLAFGRDLQDYFGVAARVSSAVDPNVWLSTGSLDRNDVFNGLIRMWQYFNNRDQTNYYVSVSSSSPMIKAVCVDEDFRECNSDRLYLNENFTDGKGGVLNDLTRDYFARQQGVFRNLRPVFKHSSRQLYLQYVDDCWVVTGAYRPKNYNDKTYMRIKDLALRPEYITQTWSVHYNGWRDEPKLRRAGV